MEDSSNNNNRPTTKRRKQQWLSKLWRRLRWSSAQNSQQEQQQEQLQVVAPSISDTENPAATHDISLICQRLANNDLSLVTLDLREHGLGSEEAAMLSSALRINETLRMLNIGSNDLGDDGVFEIMRGLQNHENIEYLLLSRNRISNVSQFAPLLLHLPSLVWLDLSENQIRDAGALFEAVGEHKKLELLDLGLNQISSGEAIGQALRKSTTLSNVNLFANHLDNDGALAIANSGFSRGLTKLNLGYNRIGNVGGKALTKALNKSFTLRELNMVGNHITNQEAKAMMKSAAAAY